ncbi:MAG: hypothetical protein WAL45_04180 [Terracidiphilus sp.]
MKTVALRPRPDRMVLSNQSRTRMGRGFPHVPNVNFVRRAISPDALFLFLSGAASAGLNLYLEIMSERRESIDEPDPRIR